MLFADDDDVFKRRTLIKVMEMDGDDAVTGNGVACFVLTRLTR